MKWEYAMVESNREWQGMLQHNEADRRHGMNNSQIHSLFHLNKSAIYWNMKVVPFRVGSLKAWNFSSQLRITLILNLATQTSQRSLAESPTVSLVFSRCCFMLTLCCAFPSTFPTLNIHTKLFRAEKRPPHRLKFRALCSSKLHCYFWANSSSTCNYDRHT